MDDAKHITIHLDPATTREVMQELLSEIDLRGMVRDIVAEALRVKDQTVSPWMTAKEVASLLRVKKDTVLQWRKQGKIEGKLNGKALLFSRCSVEAFLANK